MRSRALGGMVVLLFALGAFVTGAAAAKPKLWLEGASNTRAAPGEAARIQLVSEHCVGQQTASVASNGKPVDHIAGSGALTPGCDAGFKQTGSIKSVAVAPAPEGEVVMTVSGLVHVGVEPWCTYTVPRKFSLPPYVFTEGSTVVSGTLDKAASFGACAPTREMYIRVIVEQVSDQFPYWGEVTG
jgi:hypothetical protein